MYNIYVYVLNTLADWEIGYVTCELNSHRFFKKDAPEVVVKTVSNDKNSIKTMGGLTIIPDCVLEDIVMDKNSVLILPGGFTWNDPSNNPIIKKASELLSIGATVCGICGATNALANVGILDNRHHTSNGAGYLEMFCPSYKGKEFYVDTLAVADDNLITAGTSGALLFAKLIIKRLGVFKDETLESWYNFFSTGKMEDFYALMQSLQN